MTVLPTPHAFDSTLGHSESLQLAPAVEAALISDDSNDFAYAHFLELSTGASLYVTGAYDFEKPGSESFRILKLNPGRESFSASVEFRSIYRRVVFDDSKYKQVPMQKESVAVLLAALAQQFYG